MTTTELIALLQKHEKGGATGRSREIDFHIDGFGLLARANIEVSGTEDGLITDITLELVGGYLYPPSKDDGDTKPAYVEGV